MGNDKVRKIIEIQTAYFSLLKDCFKEPYEQAKNENGDVELGVKKWIAGKNEEKVTCEVRRRLEDLENFWGKNREELTKNLLSLNIMPIYSVSRPMFLERQFLSAGLYVDSIVCHDETLSGLWNFDVLASPKLYGLAVNLVRDYIDLLMLEKYFTCNLDVPFAVMCPGGRDKDKEIDKKIMEYSSELITAYANDLLGKNYSNWEEVDKYTSRIIGAQEIVKAIKRFEILPAPFRAPKDNRDKLSQCFERMRMLQKQSRVFIPEKPNMKELLLSFMTELAVLEGQLHGSVELDLAPLFPRYTWDLYKWRVQKGNLENSKVVGWEERKTSGITTAMQYEDLDWLSNIPPDGLIELKREGFLDEFRQKMRIARNRMTLEESVDLTKIARTMEEDIKSAIAEHIKSSKKLEEEARKRLKNKTGIFLGKISLGIASFFFPPLSVMSFVADAKQYASEMIKNGKILKSVPERLRRGLWGMMIEAKKRD